jgi:hypothetical protein
VLWSGGGASVLVQEGLGLLDRAGDGLRAGPEECAEESVGETAALVEEGGQDPVGVGERLPGASAGGSLPFAAASVAALFFPPGCLDWRQLADQGVQLWAGDAGEFRVGEPGVLPGVPLPGFRAVWSACGRGAALLGVGGVVPVTVEAVAVIVSASTWASSTFTPAGRRRC